jgi:hypothetical protein
LEVLGWNGGYMSGFGSWVLKLGHKGSGDFNDKSSGHHR